MRLTISTTLQRVNRWAGCLGLGVGVISLAVGASLAIWSVRQSEMLVKRSGGFQRAELALGIGGLPLSGSGRNTVVIGNAFNTGTVALIPLAVSLSNEGDRSAHEVIVQVSSPIAAVSPQIVDSLDWDVFNPANSIIAVAQSHSTGRGRQFSTYTASALPPGTAAEIFIPITIDFPTIRKSVTLPQKAVCTDLANADVEIVVQQENRTAQPFRVHVIACQAESLSDLRTSLVRIILDRQVEIREGQSLPRYIGTFVSRRKQSIYAEFIQPRRGPAERGFEVGATGRVLFPEADWELMRWRRGGESPVRKWTHISH